MNKRKIGILLLVISLFVCSCEQTANTKPTPGEEPTKPATSAPGTGDSSVTNAPGADGSGTNTEKQNDFTFVYQDTTIAMDLPMEPIQAALGEPNFFFEAESCAFEGKDRIYTYPGFEVYTYTTGGKEYVFSVILIDDSLTTPEGIGLGSTLEEITAAYGTDYTKNFEQYVYQKGNTRVSFLLEDGETISVEYYLVKS